ncbi:MAG: DUF192 domain-containing protein [Candidatus Brocadiaceae bacterium]|nr:DUF192 domain-containing protein [Candidatus Brocadiaceae bacterium]
MNWKSHLVTFVLIFVVVVLFAQTCRPRTGPGAGAPPDARYVTLTLEGRPPGLSELSYEVRAELADTPEARWRGLAGRQGLAPGHGMLYVYPELQRPRFSEEATGFPLSIAFLHEDGTIGEIHDTAAHDPAVVQPAEPVRHVLEVRAGWFADRGVGPGARFRMPDLQAPPAAEPPAPPEGPGEPTAPE